jgi:hypothetical protein
MNTQEERTMTTLEYSVYVARSVLWNSAKAVLA